MPRHGRATALVRLEPLGGPPSRSTEIAEDATQRRSGAPGSAPESRTSPGRRPPVDQPQRSAASRSIATTRRAPRPVPAITLPQGVIFAADPGLADPALAGPGSEARPMLPPFAAPAAGPQVPRPLPEEATAVGSERAAELPEPSIPAPGALTLPVGQARLVERSTPRRSERLHLVIFPEHRGRGYGAAALALILEKARDNSAIDWLCVTVSAEGAAAQRFLQHHGFEDRGTDWDEIAGLLHHYVRYVG